MKVFVNTKQENQPVTFIYDFSLKDSWIMKWGNSIFGLKNYKGR